MSVRNLFDRAKDDPQKVAVIDAQGRTWTRLEVVERVNRIARGLLRQGLKAGDTLVILSPNCTDYICVCLAAQQIGLYFVPLNWHLSLDEIAYVVAACSARAIVVHERHVDSINAALTRGQSSPLLAVIGAPQRPDALDKMVAGESTEQVEAPVAGRMLLFTSATTGRPKGVIRSLAGADIANTRLLEFGERLNRQAGIANAEESTHLCQSMLYHGAPLDCVLAATHLGQRIVLMDGWRPVEALKHIQEYQVTTTFMVPTMFVKLCKLPESTKRQYSTASVRMVSHGGSFCPVEVKRQMIEWWGPVFTEIYGTSEGGGTGITSSEWLSKPGSVGRPHPGADIKIVNEMGEELPRGAEGNIYIKPYSGDRFEYLGDPEKTRAVYRGEYFTAGDIGYLDSDGYLYICDRRNDLVLTGGTNVYPAEVERVLVLHQAVVDCAVFGIPHEAHGQILMAVVELQPAVEPEAAIRADLMKFLAGRIAPSKMPARLEFTKTLPRDPAGKLFRRKLLEEYTSA